AFFSLWMRLRPVATHWQGRRRGASHAEMIARGSATTRRLQSTKRGPATQSNSVVSVAARTARVLFPQHGSVGVRLAVAAIELGLEIPGRPRSHSCRWRLVV